MLHTDDNISLSTFRTLPKPCVTPKKVEPKVESKVKGVWEVIIDEYEDRRSYYNEKREQSKIKPVIINESLEYLRKEIFPYLYGGLGDTLLHAELWDALRIQKCYFSGIDHLAEVLYNTNPMYPNREAAWTKKFDIPLFKKILKAQPRPIYPLSWLWRKTYAATIIQSKVRAYFAIYKNEEIMEMRAFWKTLKVVDNQDVNKKALLEEERSNKGNMLLFEIEERAKKRQQLMIDIENARLARQEASLAKQQADKEINMLRDQRIRLRAKEATIRKKQFAQNRDVRKEIRRQRKAAAKLMDKKTALIDSNDECDTSSCDE